jgi:hypothetical protein
MVHYTATVIAHSIPFVPCLIPFNGHQAHSVAIISIHVLFIPVIIFSFFLELSVYYHTYISSYLCGRITYKIVKCLLVAYPVSELSGRTEIKQSPYEKWIHLLEILTLLFNIHRSNFIFHKVQTKAYIYVHCHWRKYRVIRNDLHH